MFITSTESVCALYFEAVLYWSPVGIYVHWWGVCHMIFMWHCFKSSYKEKCLRHSPLNHLVRLIESVL